MSRWRKQPTTTTSPTTTTTTAPTPTTGIVQRAGQGLVLGGSPYRFIGFQAGVGASPAHPICSAWTDTQVQQVFARARQVGANAMRVWLFQGYGGPQDWTRFDYLMAQARANGLRLVVTLTNQWGDCEPGGVYKSLGWYQSGYRYPDPGTGYQLSYRSFVAQMASRYKAESAVLCWQLVNEAEANFSRGGACDSLAAPAVLRTFADDMVWVIRQAGSPHLVNLGTMGSGQCGAAGSDQYRQVHGGAIDLLEYHDYIPEQAMPGDQWNGLKARLEDAKVLNKPLFVGEVGIDARPDRAQLFDAKIAAQRTAGVVGHIIWQRSHDLNDPMRVADGDPVEQIVTKYRQP